MGTILCCIVCTVCGMHVAALMSGSIVKHQMCTCLASPYAQEALQYPYMVAGYCVNAACGYRDSSSAVRGYVTVIVIICTYTIL